MEFRENFGRTLSSLLAFLILLHPIIVPAAAGQTQNHRPSGNSSSSSVEGNFSAPAVSRAALPAELAKRMRQASELRVKWRLSEAESLWREVLARDSKNREVLIGLAEIERTRLNYLQAIKYLDQASAVSPNSSADASQLLVAYGSLYLSLEEPDKAAEYFSLAREASSTFPGAIVGEAGVALLKRDYSKAKDLLSDLLTADPNRTEARICLARVYLEENRNSMAAHEAQRALDLDKFNVDAMSALCAVRMAEKNPDAVRKLAKAVLELNPYNSGVRRLLSQYLNSKKGYQIHLTPDVQAAIMKGDVFKDGGRYREAIAEYRQALALEPRAIKAWLGIGACELSANHYSAAAVAAERVLLIDPDNALGHLQLSLSHSGMYEQARIEVGATDWRNQYLSQPIEQLDDLGDIFINYSRLSPAERKVINHSVAPIYGFIKELKRKGAKHYLLSIDKRVSEIAGYESLENRMTFDGRFYASMRGVGGPVTVSGIEYLDAAMRGGFNTIAHEFAHQVHISALNNETCDRIKKLYQKAVKNGRVLDYYAASNEWEYFAQGYEAYVSNFKRPNAGVTARHTREELRQQDPELFNLMDELTNKYSARRIKGQDQKSENQESQILER